MVVKAAIDALRKADEIKASSHSSTITIGTLLNHTNIWQRQREFTHALHEVLVLDLEYALDHKAEQDLWNVGFRQYITVLQTSAKDKKFAKRGESQALLIWCLDLAAGFYLSLLHELCESYKLQLPFHYHVGRVSDIDRGAALPQTTPRLSSCFYVCQYCLVHLGDIARYRAQRKHAENYYKHAAYLAPCSGQPYNQLALLQASRGDKLSTIFYYVRSVALAHPFPPAATNLTKTLEQAVKSRKNSGPNLTVNEFVEQFSKLHGLIQTSNVEQAESIVTNLIDASVALIVGEHLDAHKLVQIFAINLYALTENPIESIRVMLYRLIFGLFNVVLNVAWVMFDGKCDALSVYPGLAYVKLTMEWIKINPKLLTNPALNAHESIWTCFCKLLNALSDFLGDYNDSKYAHMPLPEDRDLNGFHPLEKQFNKIDFTLDETPTDASLVAKLRAQRVLHLAIWLSTHSTTHIKFVAGSRVKFQAVRECVPSDDVIERIRNRCHVKSGILKPQGSLEKSREERGEKVELKHTRKTRQNVAMQAILRKVEENAKQVKFQTDQSKASSSVESTVEKSTKPDLITAGMPSTSTNTFTYANRLAQTRTQAVKSANVGQMVSLGRTPMQVGQYNTEAKHWPPNVYNQPISQPNKPPTYPCFESNHTSFPMFPNDYAQSQLTQSMVASMPVNVPSTIAPMGWWPPSNPSTSNASFNASTWTPLDDRSDKNVFTSPTMIIPNAYLFDNMPELPGSFDSSLRGGQSIITHSPRAYAGDNRATSMSNLGASMSSPPGYSLFNSNWTPSFMSLMGDGNRAQGASALERLLEQQKMMRSDAQRDGK